MTAKIAADKFARARKAAKVSCAFCRGTGTDPYGVLSSLAACPVCLGEGMVQVPVPSVSCAHCSGSGAIKTLTCTVCGGKGAVAAPEWPTRPCAVCGGSGDDTGNSAMTCLGCGGVGWVYK